MRPSRAGQVNVERILSKKAFAASHLLRELLPKKALQMASPLLDEDKEVLAYMLAFGQHLTGAASSRSKLPWKRWKSHSSKTSKQQHHFPFDEDVYPKEGSLLITNHDPTFSCNCFACYASFWSRWDASFNRDIINQVLDEVEICPETSKGKKKKKKQDKRKLTPQDRVIKHIKEDAGPLDHCACVTDVSLSSPSCCDDQSMEGAFTATRNLNDALNETSKSSDGFVDDVLSHDKAPRIVTSLMIGSTIQAAPEKNMCRIGNGNKESRVANSLNDNIFAQSIRTENEASMPSGVVGGVFCRAPNVEDKGDLTPMQACEAMAVGLSLVCMEGKTIPRLQQHHRTGKRKSNQIIPLDYGDTSPCEAEIEMGVVNEDLQAPMAGRVADLDLGGRGFLARIFPDALGRVASQLWDLVSVRLRSRTMEYY